MARAGWRFGAALLAVAALAVAACSDDGDGGDGGGSGDPTGTTLRPADPDALPADPVSLTISTEDGKELQAYYYPAAVNPAPIVVLMHWELGDLSEWYEVATWLQHRGLDNPFPFSAHAPWMDDRWFPALPDDASYGVLAFTFRGCKPNAERGCHDWTPDGWLLDAQAALLQATTLAGADASKIVAIGSGIGADGAADACAWLNDEHGGGCVGALTFSPGSYLGVSFGDTVTALGAAQPPVPVWCMSAAPTETGLCEAADTSDNAGYRAFAVENASHGNGVMVQEATPSGMQTILDFLAATLG